MLLSCFTGLAFSDVAGLNNENLVQDNLGDWWIRKGRVKLERRRKASSISNIPLLPVPLAILEKYKEHPVCMKKGCCLPVLCNQKMNSYLKEIADFCGIKKILTTHVARHTFGTTVTLANNVPLQDVSVMLGHASTRMTQHYARVMNSSLKEAMNNVKERLESVNIHRPVIEGIHEKDTFIFVILYCYHFLWKTSLVFIIILYWRNNSSWTLHIQVTVSVHRLHHTIAYPKRTRGNILR